MMQNVIFVGVDVDSKNFHYASICAQTGEITEGKARPNAKALSQALNKIHKKGYEVRCCYEATYIGFSLYRQMKELGYECIPVAASLMPKSPGDKVKTDRKDSIKLAEYYMKDLLTPVFIPDEEDERARDILRAYQFMRLQTKRQKQQIISSCHRLGYDYREETGLREYWSKSHRRWLDALTEKNKFSSTQIHFRLLLRTLHQLEDALLVYEKEIELLSKNSKYEAAHQALSCYRGINNIAAMKIILELGDIRRFNHPRKLVSYVGFDICEYSSGGSERKGKITKMGNSIIRTALIEACQSAKRRPQVHVTLKRRRKEVSLEYVDIADRCMSRLYKKSQGLLAREKPANKVKVACAREMVGFIWESLMKVTNTATKRESVDWIAKEVELR
jgi:transposase